MYLSLIIAAAALQRHSLTPHVVRLRGGQADGAPPSAGKALSREEVTTKLNSIPTFVIAGGDDKFIALDGRVVFFVDAAEAKEALALTSAGNPDMEGLHMVVLPLGTAFTACGGWIGEDPSDPGQGAVFCLRGPLQAVESSGDEVRRKMAAMGMDPGDEDSWLLPIFFSDDFQKPGMMPLFFCERDLDAGYERSGNPPGAGSLLDIDCMDLRALVASMMQSDAMPWAVFQLVASAESYELAKELKERDSEAADEE